MSNKKKWITNGTDQRKIDIDDNVPPGYKYGRNSVSSEAKGRMSLKKKNTCYINNGVIEKRIDINDLSSYLENGWEKGRIAFSTAALANIKNARKTFFEHNPHWKNQNTWVKNQPAWNKNMPMSEETKKKLSEKKTGTHLSSEAKQRKVTSEKITRTNNAGALEISYQNATAEKMKTINEILISNPQYYQEIDNKRKNTCIEKYGYDSCSKSPKIKAKRQQTCLQKYGVPIATQNAAIKQKIFDSKKANNTFNKSKDEDILYEILCEHFAKDDIVRQYKDPKRYPFHCDFYIKSIDMFIELHLFWTHGYHAFNADNAADQKMLAEWSDKAKNSKFYAGAIKTWTVADPKKLKTAYNYNLKYITIYTEGELNDFIRRIQEHKII